MSKHLGPTAFTRFRAEAPFDFKLSQFQAEFRQRSDGSRDYFTRNPVLLHQQVRAAGAPVRVMAEGVRLACLPAARWQRDYGRQRVLFVLPSDALGDCVGVVLFLRAFRRRFPEAAITVANTGAATDIFGAEAGVRVLPLVISGLELERHHPVIDLGEVEGWDAVTTQPVDVETRLLQRFGLDPVDIQPSERRDGPRRFAILPMASSPLRTLPPATAAALAGALGDEGGVTLLLNGYQGLAAAYNQMLLPLLPEGVEVLPGFASTRGLLDFLAGQDFVVAADSGPAHLTKLFGTPGVAIYSSASGEVLQGRHRNLERWQVAFEGPHCVAPCGLAKLRAAADGRVGCMGSLGLRLAELPNLPPEARPDIAKRLTLDTPVPCIAELGRQQAALGQFVAAALRRALCGRAEPS